jgi:hypothetical protein
MRADGRDAAGLVLRGGKAKSSLKTANPVFRLLWGV